MISSVVERLVYTEKAVGPIPTSPTMNYSFKLGFIINQKFAIIHFERLGSSVVERSPEEAGVVSSILTRGTKVKITNSKY